MKLKELFNKLKNKTTFFPIIFKKVKNGKKGKYIKLF